MTSIATDTANDVGCEVLSLGAIVFPVTDHTAVLAGLVLVVTQGTVEGRKLAQLVALELVLTFGNGSGL